MNVHGPGLQLTLQEIVVARDAFCPCNSRHSPFDSEPYGILQHLTALHTSSH